ncbi:AMP-binding protein [Rothia nasimurium]|uniref:AMP-binding protein n=1 Tax=Rothia nasimurium TaxID=85336 RepID=UPI001F2EDF75|nr:AMP-binding protein [Rothia nasimurium]
MSVTEEFRTIRDQLVALREDYAAAREQFTWPRFEHFNFALDWFDQVAASEERKDAPALIIAEQDGSSVSVSYAEMSQRSSQVANWLRSVGVKRGDRVILMLGNQVELWELMLAGIKLGVILMPSTEMLEPVDLDERISRGTVEWVITNSKNVPKFERVEGNFTVIETDGKTEGALTKHPHLNYLDAASAPTDFTPDATTRGDEPLLWYFTSGTTSRAKMVEHTHTSYPVGHLSTMYWIGMGPGDVHLNVASPGWAKHAWSNIFTPWIAEATVFIYNYSRFDAAALMQNMEKFGVTSFCAPPTVWRMLIQADLSQLATPPTKVVAAGEPLNPEVISKVKTAWGVDIRDGFGQTESTVQIANTPGQPIKIGAMGKPLPGYDIVLIDPATDEISETEGEICIRLGDARPLGLMTQYKGDPEKTEDTMRGGFYHTGDIAERDENGVLTYVGRADDVFKASDYKLSPFELESVVIEHPAVAEAAVVPSPDEIRLAVPKAYIVLAAGHEPTAETAKDILKYARDHLAAYKRVRRIEFYELPKTISGKIRRVELRARENEFHGRHGEKSAAALAARTTTEGYGHEFADTDFPDLKS